MIGHESILEARRRAMPLEWVMVHIGADRPAVGRSVEDYVRGIKWADLVIEKNDSLSRLDLRCLSGLPALLVAHADDEVAVDRVIARLLSCGATNVDVLRMWLPADDERMLIREAIGGKRI